MRRAHRPARSVGPGPAESAEAIQLADALRHCRLSVLCGDVGAGKSALIADGLMPRLRRRAADTAVLAARAELPGVLPFPERRTAVRARLAEIVVRVDDWGTEPLLELHAAIDAALRAAGIGPDGDRAPLHERVKRLGDRYGTRLLFVLDGFDPVLRMWREADGEASLVNALITLLNQRLPANVLIAVRLESLAHVQALRSRLVYADVEVVSLPSAARPSAPVVVALPAAASPREAVYADISSTLARLNAAGGPAPGDAARAEDDGSRAAAARRPPSDRWLWLSSAGLALVLVAIGIFASRFAWNGDPATRPPSDWFAAAPPAAGARPPVDIGIESEDGETPPLARQLARALAGDPRFELRLIATQAPMASPSPLAIVRYDALQDIAARRPAAASAPIGVVAPLYREELYVAVRADSPLRYFHELREQRLNVGPATGARALTARHLYAALFGSELAPDRQDHRDARDALEQLAAHAPFDAVVLAEAQPGAVWAALDPALKRTLRLLRVDPAHPSTQRALQSYLPATLRDASLPAAGIPTLSSLAFLVANENPDAAAGDLAVSVTRSLCAELPALRRDGDPKWTEVARGLQLDTPLPPTPRAGAAGAAWRDCAAPRPAVSFPPPPGARP